MKVSFRIKFRDHLALFFRQVFGSPGIWVVLVFIIVIGIKPNWQAVMHTAPEKSLTFQIVLFIILNLIPVFFSFIILGFILVVATVSKMLKIAPTDFTITLGDEMILIESAYSREELQWAAIKKLVKTRSHLFLFVRKLDDLVIPKRAFNSDEECNRFWDMCQAKLKT